MEGKSMAAVPLLIVVSIISLLLFVSTAKLLLTGKIAPSLEAILVIIMSLSAGGMAIFALKRLL